MQFPSGPGGGPMPPEGMGTFVGLFALIVFVLFLLPFIFYLVSLQKNLRRCGPAAQMAPGLVWLNLVPLLNIAWIFVTVIQVAKSNQVKARELNIDLGDGAFVIGLLMAIFPLLTWIPLLGILLGLASLVLWIIHWVKVAGFSQQIATADSP